MSDGPKVWDLFFSFGDGNIRAVFSFSPSGNGRQISERVFVPLYTSVFGQAAESTA